MDDRPNRRNKAASSGVVRTASYKQSMTFIKNNVEKTAAGATMCQKLGLPA